MWCEILLIENVSLCVLESSLLQYYYTPIEIYRFQVYLKGVEFVNQQKKQLRKDLKCIDYDIDDEDTEGMEEEGGEEKERLLREQESALEESLTPLIEALPVIVDLPAEQHLVLVKWNNQTYDQITWELEESVKHEQNKILTYHRINRLPDARTLVSPFR